MGSKASSKSSGIGAWDEDEDDSDPEDGFLKTRTGSSFDMGGASNPTAGIAAPPPPIVGGKAGLDLGPEDNVNVTVTAPEENLIGGERRDPGKPSQEHELVREHEGHPALHDKVPSPLLSDEEQQGQLAKGDVMTEEPESTLTDDEEEELRVPGSFDLSGPPQQHEGAGSWGDMLRKLRLTQ